MGAHVACTLDSAGTEVVAAAHPAAAAAVDDASIAVVAAAAVGKESRPSCRMACQRAVAVAFAADRLLSYRDREIRK